MAEEANVAAPEAVVEEAKVEPKAETIAEIIGTEAKPEPKLVPEAAFLEEKRGRKDAEKTVRDLQKKIESGASDAQVSASLDEIADEFNVDKKFLNKLTAAIRKDVETESETRISAKLKPFEDNQRADQVQKVFTKAFDKAMTDMEDYKDIVNKDAIFALSLNPANASKTMAQLIEDTYGNAVSGKRSIEMTTPRGGAASGELDMARANSDPAYLDEVLKDPALKKQLDEKSMEIAKRA
jgi:hypothetical protein